MPGTPSGENHSSDNHTCGRRSMPRRSRSAYRRRTCAASGELRMESLRSQKRLLSSCSSDRRTQGRALARAAILVRRLGDMAGRIYEEIRGRELTQALTRCLLRAQRFRRLRAWPVLAAPPRGSAAELQHRVGEQPIRAALDQLLFDQAVAPQSGDRTCSVVRTRKRPARRGDHIGVAAEVGGREHRITQIPCAGKGLQRRGERGGGALVQVPPGPARKPRRLQHGPRPPQEHGAGPPPERPPPPPPPPAAPPAPPPAP